MSYERYKSEITCLPNGVVTIATWIDSIHTQDPPENGLLTREEFHYPSVKALRASLVKQEFHAKAARGWNKLRPYVIIGGYALDLVGRLNILPIPSIFNGKATVTGEIATIALISGIFGNRIWDYERRVDSRVKTFNETDFGLQPVTFNPRDYLSAVIRIPFRH